MFLLQGNVKKSGKSIKMVNIEGEPLEGKNSNLLSNFRNFNKIFRKDVP